MTSSQPLKRVLAGVAIGSCLLTAATAARAGAVSIQFDPSGLPAPIGPIHALDLTDADIGKTSFLANHGAVHVDVNTVGGQGVVSGSRSGLYAAPVSGGSATSESLWSQPYFSTGLSGSNGLGTITLNVREEERYFGLLWGSVDSGSTTNSITFNTVKDGVVTQVAVVTGNDIDAATGATSGSQAYGGSFYTVLDDLQGMFNQIVLSSSIVSFEAADIQYSSATVALSNVPEPATIALLGTGLLALAALRHRRQAAPGTRA